MRERMIVSPKTLKLTVALALIFFVIIFMKANLSILYLGSLWLCGVGDRSSSVRCTSFGCAYMLHAKPSGRLVRVVADTVCELDA